MEAPALPSARTNHVPGEEISLALARHQLRRAQGVPTLSVLVGSPAEAADHWRRWVASAGWSATVATWPLDHPSTHGPGRDDGNPPVGIADEGRTAAVPLPAACLYVPGDGLDDPAARAAGLFATARRLCARLETLGDAQWTTAVALAVEAADAAAFLRDAPESRAKTFFREGLIALEAPVAPPRRAPEDTGRRPEPEIITRHPPQPAIDGPAETFADTAGLLTRERASARTLASFQTAAAALREATTTTTTTTTTAASIAGAEGADTTVADDDDASVAAEDGKARSAAERFLFDLLGDLPETAGLFTLNAKLDFCFGPMLAEVDLLAADLRLAVEIDGYYHFADAEHYRRDRRKDVCLQKQDFLVLRFLAEDVVARLEEILREILAAVAFRRVTLGERRG